uniref:Target of Nesh-SH3-like n=1 Tax=Sinocyclocheilus anshuiensis TaxID=1608454 RepID=A0A671PH14_9TELE
LGERDNMQAFILLFLSEILLLRLTSATTLKVQRQNMRVRISAVGDTIVFKFFQPHVDTRLEGYILGYGSSMFSKQFIQLPEDGQPYETEIDAEPKYLIAVQSKNPEEPKKKCAGKVDLEKPLNIVIGSVTQSSVLLSWGTLMTSPFMDTVLDDCFDEGYFTVRYREKEPSDTWNYQTCPSTSTVIDNLKPGALYEFAVSADTNTNSGVWSPTAIHNTAGVSHYKSSIFTTQPPPTTIQPYTIKTHISVKDQPYTAKQLLNTAQHQFSETSSPNPPTTKPPIHQTPQLATSTIQEHPHPSKKQDTITQDSLHTRKIQPSTKLHRLSTTQHSRGTSKHQTTHTYFPKTTSHYQSSTIAHSEQPNTKPPPTTQNWSTNSHSLTNTALTSPTTLANIVLVTDKHTDVLVSQLKTNVSKHPLTENIQERIPHPVPITFWYQPRPSTTTKHSSTIKQQASTAKYNPKTDSQIENRQPTPEECRFDTGDNSSVFSSHPLSEVDATGKKRFVAPHVVYRTDKRPEEPCSVTHSLSFFPDEEVGYLNVTGPPKTPPSNLTVVTVEGCPSFIILDWDKTDNETTEYEVVSSTKGLHGEEVSIETTNQTHTAVENLKPESSYEFKVTPKNELGSGPASEPVTFSTESADPRVSEIQTGKNAIWSSFPFKADSYSECNGQQFIKRTWYRKFVGIQLCNSLRYKIYLSDSLNGKFYSIGDQTGYGEDHCQFVDSFLDGRTGGPLSPDQLPPRKGFYRAMRQEPVKFGEIGGNSMINYMAWYECGIPIPGMW